MPVVVPTYDEIATLPQPLTLGENELLRALEATLQDHWTIFVQPHMNGDRPDFVIFSPKAGIGVFEVKDWDLRYSAVQQKGEHIRWTVRHQFGQEIELKEHPLQQVQKYHDSLLRFQLSQIFRKALEDKKAFGAIQKFLYFSKHNSEELIRYIPRSMRKFTSVLGYDDLEASNLQRALARSGLEENGRYAQYYADSLIENQLRNALGYPEHGQIDARYLKLDTIRLTPKQNELRPNEPGRARRVVGAAGSGKSVLAALKAVDAAQSGKKVLLTCFNITMANYLRDVVTCLARQRGPHIHRNIQVTHFHAIESSDEVGSQVDSVDVLLVDEGQDFKREWLETLRTRCSASAHFMFFEDARQNVYGVDSKDRATVPGIAGRPNILNTSYRVPEKIASLANRIAAIAKREDDAVLETADTLPLFPDNGRPRWIGAKGLSEAVESLANDVAKECSSVGGTAPADIAILVCTRKDGRKVLEALKLRKLPYVATFPDEEVLSRLRSTPMDSADLTQYDRTYKVEFWMQTGRIKVCSIHSFKGWELKNIYVLFCPSAEQKGSSLELLYVAVTRSQQYLAIYSTDWQLANLARELASAGLVQLEAS